MNKKDQDTIISRIIRLYKELSRIRNVNEKSQMCNYWENPTIDVFEGSDELVALETEFGVYIDEDKAVDLYDMTIQEAAVFIESLIKEQQGNNAYKSIKIIDKLSPEMAKRVLSEIWIESFKGRNYITAAIDKINYMDKLKKGKT